MLREKVVLIYSGGVDSTTLLYLLRSEGHDVSCLGINYGQRHLKELESAEQICKDLGVRFEIADLSGIRYLLRGSSQTSDSVDVPEGYYTDESMRLTVVSNRNMIMLSVAAGWAISLGAGVIAYAAHLGDHSVYPDCRQEFVLAMSGVLELCHYSKIALYAPFQAYDKASIVQLGARLGVPYSGTWSCYKGLGFHCGRCGTCVERREAFQLAGVVDPTIYQSV